jgi:hypothetical protein
MKKAIVLALLLMRMVAEEIVMEAEGNQPQISADQSGIKKIKRGAWLHRAYFLDLYLKLIITRSGC